MDNWRFRPRKPIESPSTPPQHPGCLKKSSYPILPKSCSTSLSEFGFLPDVELHTRHSEQANYRVGEIISISYSNGGSETVKTKNGSSWNFFIFYFFLGKHGHRAILLLLFFSSFAWKLCMQSFSMILCFQLKDLLSSSCFYVSSFCFCLTRFIDDAHPF